MNLSADEQDFDMAAVLRDLWAARLYLALCCALSVLGVFVFLHAARPYYQASIMVAPAQNIESVAYNSGVFPEGLPVY
ncbi:MAG: Wzz/FepE/Etk N-terminal domain-containing protein, partial [Bdellovibrionales bacterium]